MTRASCKVHGRDTDPQILSITPALPGWSVAFVEPSTGEVWVDPIAAWCLVEHAFAADMPACSCVCRSTHAMVAGEFGALEVIDEGTAHVVPPNFKATWHAKPNPHWVVAPSTEAVAPAAPPVTA